VARTALTWDQVGAWRARRQMLAERAPRADLLHVVSRLCGVHAQLMSSAELTLWARVDDLEPDAVATALWEDRTLVKTWAMRGTLHLLRADELDVWLAALGTYKHFLKPSWARAFGLRDVDHVEQLIAEVGAALDGPPLTREELAERVDDKLRESWGALLKPAAFRGLLCFAPGDGSRVRFTRPDRWVGEVPSTDPDAALAEVARRFLAAYGPTTREEFARWWTGLTPAQAGRLIASLDGAAEVDVEGDARWMHEAHAAEAAAAAPGGPLRLLPAFDQYVVGATRHAERLMPGAFAPRVYRPQGWLTPVLCAGGRIEGVWRHERKGRRVVVEVEPFGRLTKARRAEVEAEAERLASFLGGELSLAAA
jgi:hypothetical protein